MMFFYLTTFGPLFLVSPPPPSFRRSLSIYLLPPSEYCEIFKEHFFCKTHRAPSRPAKITLTLIWIGVGFLLLTLSFCSI